MVDGPEDNCYFCGENASKKEVVIMVNKDTKVEGRELKPVPPKPKRRKAIWAYWEKNKAAIVADYRGLPLREFFKRWRISSNAWGKLKNKWGIPNKQGQPQAATRPRAEDTPVRTEHEKYLVLVGYRQAVRELLIEAS